MTGRLATWWTVLALPSLLAAQEPLRLEPVCAFMTNGRSILVTGSATCTTNSAPFLAVVGQSWPAGLVPVFAVEKENSFELRRLPARGTEPGAEPLFFALPREDEPHAGNFAGAWNGAATNAQNSKYFPDWELAIDGERVAGRFSPQGEYRVAYITGGIVRSNRLELHAEYFQDRYTLHGELRDGQLVGTWRQHDDSDRGRWSATRPPQPAWPKATDVVPLYEWKRGPEGRYGTESPDGPGWQRGAQPLCRVWAARKMPK